MISKRVAITGGKGRIAPGLVRFFRISGYQVEVFSRTAGTGCHAIEELLSPMFFGTFDALVHLGWSSVPRLSEENAGIEAKEDLPLAHKICSLAAESSNPPQIVFFSTAAVYGNTGLEFAVEDSVCRPVGRYAAAKQAAEEIFLKAPRACILRVTNVFGSFGKNIRPQGIVPMLIKACRSGKTFTLWGDGRMTKDYISVNDVYRAVEKVVRSSHCGVFNVSSGQSFSVLQLVDIITSAIGRHISVVQEEPFPWDIELSFVSSQRLQKVTGWKPEDDPASTIFAMAEKEAGNCRVTSTL